MATPNQEDKTTNAALALIRQKITGIYKTEPSAKPELRNSEEVGHKSKHQQFMYSLSTSGKSLAEIQTSWHNYYLGLSDEEKHQVWQEFYAVNGKDHLPTTEQLATPQQMDIAESPKYHHKNSEHVSARRKVTAKHNLKSLIFGFGMGIVVLLFLLFGFFNERFIAPFITPSKNISTTPIIIDANTTAVGPEPKLIIPKINVELPVVFNQSSIEEKAFQKSLEGGVVHYPTTSLPGELGNGAIFGHSSNNILNQGKYKFAFVLLKRLENGDTFSINRNNKRYVYKVYEKRVVKPEDISVLGSSGRSATFALITCDPPGTSINRLVVWGEQISPDSNANVASTAKSDVATPTILPSNAPSLWQRFIGWFSS